VAPQQPDRVKVKTMAALFASLALMAAKGAHAAVHALPGGFDDSSAFTVSTTNDAFASLEQPSVLRLYEAGWAGPACTIVGTPGPDLIFGTQHRDVICRLGGNDLIDGMGGNDVIFGGPGNDTLNGGSGDDVIYGGPGNDRIQATTVATPYTAAAATTPSGPGTATRTGSTAAPATTVRGRTSSTT
jgi:Ca2+-binding RTX toxin-like protein